MRKSSDEFVRLPRNQCWRNIAKKTLAAWGHVLAITLLVAAMSGNATASEDLATQLKNASALHQHADYAHSIPMLKRIVQQSPRNYVANLLLGEDLVRIGKFQDAVVPLQVAAEARPEDATAEVYLAEAATALGNFSMASEALQSGLARSGGSDQFLEAWASYCLERFRVLGISLRVTKRGEGTGLRVEAASHPEGSETRESLLQESAAADPEQRGIWGELGIAQLELRKRAEVEASLNEAQRREPQGAETLQLEALLAAVEQNWSGAEERLLSIGARSPAELRRVLATWLPVLVPGPEISGTVWDCLRNTAVPCPLVTAEPQGGEGLSAKDLYAEGRWEPLKALPPPASSDRSEWLWRGVAFAKIGDCPRAIPSLERGLQAGGRVADFWLEVCYASEAESTAARLNTEGNEAALHQLRGDVLLRLRGDAAAAQKQYAEALKSRPRDPHLLERLAEAYMRIGDAVHARKAALAALAVDRRQPSALQTLALMAMSERNYTEALVRLRQLIGIDPQDAWTQVEMGVAYGQLGHPQDAVHYLEPALAANYPDEKGALHALLASALRKLGREQEAKSAAAEAARLANAFQTHEHGNTDAHE